MSGMQKKSQLSIKYFDPALVQDVTNPDKHSRMNHSQIEKSN